MADNVQNPLKKYFRQPAIYIKLPSNGKYWEDNALELTATSELPVYPMTINDEIHIKTPDALINGQGIVEVIQSCCPNIKDAWKTPSVDMDKILVAIRIASYGEKLDFETQCPNCSERNNYEFDLHSILGKDVNVDKLYSTPIAVNNVKIYLKPQSFFNVNQVNQIQFEEQQLIRTFSDTEMQSDAKAIAFKNHMERLVALNELNLTESTRCIVTEDGVEVTDRHFIAQFYHMCDSKVVKLLQDKLAEIKKEFDIPPFNITCDSCGHKYEQTFIFEYSNFFE